MKIKREGGESYGGWKVRGREKEIEKGGAFSLVLILYGRWGLHYPQVQKFSSSKI